VKRDENRRAVMRADPGMAARDNVLGPESAAAATCRIFGDRFGHRRLRVSREKRPEPRSATFLPNPAHFAMGMASQRARPGRQQAPRLRDVGPRPIFPAAFQSSLMT